MPDQPTTNSTTIPTLLNKRTQDMLGTLTSGTLVLVSAAPLDSDGISRMVGDAGNALTTLAEDSGNREYFQAQQNYALISSVQQALRVIESEPTLLDDLAVRETASTNQLKVVGTQALLPMAFAYPDPRGLAAIVERGQ